MIGEAALLADGVITPAITVTSSIEGLRLFSPDISVVPIVLIIFAFYSLCSSSGPILWECIWSNDGNLVLNAWDSWILSVNSIS